MAENFGVQGRGAFYDQTGTDPRRGPEPPVPGARQPRDGAAGAHRQRVDARREGQGAEVDSAARAPTTSCAGSSAATAASRASRRIRRSRPSPRCRLEIDSWRWQGVPFYIRAGKCLPVTCTEVVVRLRRPPTIFPTCAGVPNHVRFRISPEMTHRASASTVMDAEDEIDRAAGRAAREPPPRRRGDGRLRARAGRRDGRRRARCSRARTTSRKRGASSIRCCAARHAGLRVRAGHLGSARGRRTRRRRRRLAESGRRPPERRAHAPIDPMQIDVLRRRRRGRDAPPRHSSPTEARAAVAARGRFVVGGQRRPHAVADAARARRRATCRGTTCTCSRSTSASRPAGDPDRNLTHIAREPARARRRCRRTRSTRCRSRPRISTRPRRAMRSELADDRRARRRCSISSISASAPTATRRRSCPGDPVLDVADRDVALTGAVPGPAAA